jgi:histone acetyltransferase (RNA polymerase elongator complex component)
MHSFVYSSIQQHSLTQPKYKKHEEAEIASLAEHLLKETFYSVVNQIYFVLPGCKGAKDAHPPQDNLQKERWASDAVQAHPLYSLDYCSAG